MKTAESWIQSPRHVSATRRRVDLLTFAARGIVQGHMESRGVKTFIKTFFMGARLLFSMSDFNVLFWRLNSPSCFSGGRGKYDVPTATARLLLMSGDDDDDLKK